MSAVCVLTRRLESGEVCATLGIDLAASSPAPGGEMVYVQIDEFGAAALPGEALLGVRHPLDELLVIVHKCLAVVHHAAGSNPLLPCEKRYGDAG